VKPSSAILLLAIAVFGSASIGCATGIWSWRARRGAQSDGSLTTDATNYVAMRIPSPLARYRFTVITDFQNRGADPVYLGRCTPNSRTPLFGVRMADGSPTRSAYDRMWPCVGHDMQFEVLPGAVRTDTLFVEGPNMFDGRTNVAEGNTEGTFRLSFEVQAARGDGAKRMPDSVSRSNAFTVRVAK
jgi:hypothetical protein